MNILQLIKFPQKVIHSTCLNKFGPHTPKFVDCDFEYLSLGCYHNMLTIELRSYISNIENKNYLLN